MKTWQPQIFVRRSNCTWIVVIIVLTGCITCKREQMQTPSPAQTYVRIGTSLRESRGYTIQDWMLIDGSSVTEYDGPQNLTIVLPSGETLTMTAKRSTVFCWNGIASSVFVLRPEQSVSFQKAKADALATLQKLNIKLDNHSEQTLARWTEDPPGHELAGVMSGAYQVNLVKACEDIEVGIRIVTDPEQGWLYFLEFTKPVLPLNN